MAVGMNPVVANQILAATFTGVSFAGFSTVYVQMHTQAGDPGIAGTANISSYATRTLVSTFGTPASGILAITAPVVITASWTGTNGEVLRYVSYWSALTGGTFISSDQLTADLVMATGGPLNLPSLVIPMTPIAA